MTPIWTIDLTPEVITEGTSFAKLAADWPHAGSHDDVNTVFVDYIPDDITALKVYSMEDDGYALTGDALFSIVGVAMFADDQPIQLYKWQAEELFRRVEYRLYCGKYATKEAFNIDYNAVFHEDTDLDKTLDELVLDSRARLKIMLNGA